MKKYQYKNLSILLTLLLFVGVVAKINDTQQKADLGKKIDLAIAEYQRGNSPHIDLRTIDNFRWDQVYAFGPYSRCTDIVNVLVTPFFMFACKFSGIEESDGYTLFVFKNRRSITRYVMYFGPSISSNSKKGHSFNDAQLVVDKKGRLIWLKE